jgi:hypothetical protein
MLNRYEGIRLKGKCFPNTGCKCVGTITEWNSNKEENKTKDEYYHDHPVSLRLPPLHRGEF